VFRRGPDILPRKQIVATLQMAALGQQQSRDPKTGRLSRGKRARLARGAGMRDLFRARTRLLYVLAHGDAQEAATLASAVTRTGDYFAAYLDDKPTGQPRVTKFILSTEEPSQEVPPDQGQRRLGGPSAAEEGYVEVREEDAL